MDGSRDSLLAAGHQPSEGRTAAAAAASKAHPGRLSWQHVVLEAWRSALAMVLVYVITLSIFPGVSDVQQPVQQPVLQPLVATGSARLALNVS